MLPVRLVAVHRPEPGVRIVLYPIERQDVISTRNSTRTFHGPGEDDLDSTAAISAIEPLLEDPHGDVRQAARTAVDGLRERAGSAG